MEERVSVQGIPVGELQTVEQSVATDTWTFYAGQNGLAIATALPFTHAGWASVVKKQRTLNCSTKAERTHLRSANPAHWQHTPMKRQQPQGVTCEMN